MSWTRTRTRLEVERVCQDPRHAIESRSYFEELDDSRAAAAELVELLDALHEIKDLESPDLRAASATALVARFDGYSLREWFIGKLCEWHDHRNGEPICQWCAKLDPHPKRKGPCLL